MPKAIFNGTVVAESESTVVVEGNHYFPPSSIRQELLTETDKTTVCPWKGTANYFTVEVNGERGENAAWVYHEPKSAASEIAEHVAFWGAVRVEA